jgi:hypothetical protein
MIEIDLIPLNIAGDFQEDFQSVYKKQGTITELTLMESRKKGHKIFSITKPQ